MFRKDNREIERKFVFVDVRHLSEVTFADEGRLLRHLSEAVEAVLGGAEMRVQSLETLHGTDEYWRSPRTDTGPCREVRLRTDTVADPVLTIKNPVLGSETVREEFNLKTHDYRAAVGFLRGLGLQLSFTVEKDSRVWTILEAENGVAIRRRGRDFLEMAIYEAKLENQPDTAEVFLELEVGDDWPDVRSAEALFTKFQELVNGDSELTAPLLICGESVSKRFGAKARALGGDHADQ